MPEDMRTTGGPSSTITSSGQIGGHGITSKEDKRGGVVDNLVSIAEDEGLVLVNIE